MSITKVSPDLLEEVYMTSANGSLSGTITGTYTLAGTPTITAPTITNPTITTPTITTPTITTPIVTAGTFNAPSITGGVATADPTATLGLATKGVVDRQTHKAVAGSFANAAGDVTNDIDFGVTACMDDAGTDWIQVAALTKQLDVNWVVGNNQGMLSTGAIANVPYYLWAIKRPDTGVTDYLADVSFTAPTLPANYTKKRCIGYIERLGAAISLFRAVEYGGGAVQIDWTVPALQVDVAATLTTARDLRTVKVPTAFSTTAILTVSITDAAAASGVRITCPDETDAAPSLTVAPLCNIATQVAAQPIVRQLRIRTSATGQIAARATIATIDNYRVQTDGFIWSRR